MADIDGLIERLKNINDSIKALLDDYDKLKYP